GHAFDAHRATGSSRRRNRDLLLWPRAVVRPRAAVRSRRSSARERTMNRTLAPALAATFRRVAAPLAWYYGVTLGLPLANGAAHGGAAFVEHALAVLVLPPALVVFACVAREIARACCARTHCGVIRRFVGAVGGVP